MGIKIIQILKSTLFVKHLPAKRTCFQEKHGFEVCTRYSSSKMVLHLLKVGLLNDYRFVVAIILQKIIKP
jgi:hypothetical protein